MAKKLTKKRTTQRDKGKTRFEVRFDDEVVEQLRSLAEKAQISVNQLLHGLARWAVQDPHVGDPIKTDDGVVRCQRPGQEQPGAIWWGKPARYARLMGEELDQYIKDVTRATGYEPDPEECEQRVSDGEVHIRLDFTERRVVRDD